MFKFRRPIQRWAKIVIQLFRIAKCGCVFVLIVEIFFDHSSITNWEIAEIIIYVFGSPFLIWIFVLKHMLQVPTWLLSFQYTRRLKLLYFLFKFLFFVFTLLNQEFCLLICAIYGFHCFKSVSISFFYFWKRWRTTIHCISLFQLLKLLHHLINNLMSTLCSFIWSKAKLRWFAIKDTRWKYTSILI